MSIIRWGNEMSRRRFVLQSSAAIAGLAVTPGVYPRPVKKNLTAGELNTYLNSLGTDWVDPDRTVDTFKSGGPEVEVKGIAVGWMSYTGSLKEALELECNVFITHEPTYYNHRDNDEKIFRFEQVVKKREFIERSKITIIRCHDVWDQYPDIGIPMAWGKFLGLGEPIDGSGYFYVYDGKGQTAAEIARKISTRVKYLGQQGVQFIGPDKKPVQRIVLGTGAITPMFRFIEELNADLAICTDDGFVYWRDGAFAIDNDFPVVLVNHPVSEDHGMKLLAAHLSKVFPEIPVHHIPQRCMYKMIQG